MAFFKSVISRLKMGLSRTRTAIGGGLRARILGRRLDEALIADVERMFLEADIGVAATRKLIDSARDDFKAGKLERPDDLLAHLKRGLKDLLGGPQIELVRATSGPTVFLVTGINGAGKTTSIAKLAALFRSEGRKVMLAACDTFRAGAVRQLEIWAERLGAELVKGQQGGDPAAVAFDACKAAVARQVDVLILDTAGRLQTQDPLMRQLAKIHSVVARQIPGAPHETILVLDATTGQNALRQAEEFSKAAKVSGIFLAKLDGTARGGIVVAIRHGTAIPVKFVGLGETPDDVEPFDSDAFVEALLGD